MEAINYDPKIHFKQICDWAEARGLESPPESALSSRGKVVPDCCAIFLYQTDSTLGFIEGLIANPKQPKSEVAHAIDLCVQAVEEEAKALGIKYLIGHFSIKQVGGHAIRLGYDVFPDTYQLLSKELT